MLTVPMKELIQIKFSKVENLRGDNSIVYVLSNKDEISVCC